MTSTEFNFNYKDLNVQQDEVTNMIIIHSIATKVKQDDLFIKINGIEYDVEINEILKSNSNENLVADLGSTYSQFVSFFSSKDSVDRSVLVKFPKDNFTKFVNSRLINGKFLFKISCVVDYEIYFYQNGYYYLKNIKRSPPTFIHDSNYEYRVQPTDEQISSAIEKNKYTNKLTIELPSLDEPRNNHELGSAIENLKLAAQGFVEGNFNSIILNTRNAINNNLTKLEDIPKSPNKKRMLKDDIVESCLSHVPAKYKDDYNEILKYIGSITASLSSITSKYIHENQNTIRMRPLHADLELLYFSALLITKYLTSLNNIKL